MVLQKNVICEKCEGKNQLLNASQSSALFDLETILSFVIQRKIIYLFQCAGQRLHIGDLRAKLVSFFIVRFLFGLHTYLICWQLF